MPRYLVARAIHHYGPLTRSIYEATSIRLNYEWTRSGQSEARKGSTTPCPTIYFNHGFFQMAQIAFTKFLGATMPCLLPFSSYGLAHPSIYSIWHQRLPRPAIQMRWQAMHPSIKHVTKFLGLLILLKVTTLATGHSGYGGSANPQKSSKMRVAHKTRVLTFCTINQSRIDYRFCHRESVCIGKTERRLPRQSNHLWPTHGFFGLPCQDR